MKVTIQKLGITIEDDEPALAAGGAPIPGCPNGYAVYAFRQSRSLERVGGATCLFPSSCCSASNAGPFMMISSAFSAQLSGMLAVHGQLKELRFAVCCPPPPILSLAKAKQAKRKSPGKGKRSR